MAMLFFNPTSNEKSPQNQKLPNICQDEIDNLNKPRTDSLW